MKREACIGHGSRHRHYSLTCAEFNALVLRGEGRCERCGKPSRNLVIDHDHALGLWAVRGLVCVPCNGSPGMWAVEKQGPMAHVVFHEDRLYFDRAFYLSLSRFSEKITDEAQISVSRHDALLTPQNQRLPNRVKRKRPRKDGHRVPGRLIRPEPESLWDRLGQKVGNRKRSETISRLIAGFLDGKFVLEEEKTPPTER